MSKATEKKAEKLSTEVAKQALLKERQERSEACRKEVEAALKKHRCGIMPILTMSPNGTQWGVDFPPID